MWQYYYIDNMNMIIMNILVKPSCHSGIWLKNFNWNVIQPIPELSMTSWHALLSQLYCCKDYQELVEYTMENTPLSQHPSDDLIDIAPHAPYGSKQARRAAKERAAQRMREREMARQRAAGSNQANFYACKFLTGACTQYN